jgi:glycosyltransferase involved in cell wall biosynthesis
MVGRFDIQKGQENFIRAVGIIAEDYPNARFFVIGRHCDPANEHINKWVRESKLQGRVFLLGERHDVADCLAALDVFCLPSVVEGFPNALGEAMATGLACVTTDAGAAEELLDGHGLLVPVADAPALADAIERLVKMGPADRATLGQAARCHIVQKYGLDNVLAAYIKTYNNLVRSTDN